MRKVGFISIQRRKIIVVDIAGQLVIELFFLVVVPLQLLDNLYVCPSMFGQWKKIWNARGILISRAGLSVCIRPADGQDCEQPQQGCQRGISAIMSNHDAGLSNELGLVLAEM